MDVKNDYLNSPMNFDLYVEWPEGFVVSGEKFVCKLRKSLKENEQNWNSLLHLWLVKISLSHLLNLVSMLEA